MSTERDITPIVRSWLEIGPTTLPDHVLDSVMDRLPATPQRRAPWWTRMSALMASPMRVAVAAAVIALFAVIGLGIAPRWGDQIGTEMPSPSLAPSPLLAPSPAVSPVASLSLKPPADADAFVTAAYEGLANLPPLTVTVVEEEGTKARYMYDGAGLLHHDHFSNATNDQPSEFRIFSRDVMAESTDLNGEQVWLQYTGQGHPLAELAGATGLQPYCETAWEYVGLEYLLERPTHHVACGASEMWLDVETRLPLRSIRVQGGDLPTIRKGVTELVIGPQPAELFQPPAGMRVMTDREFQCASDPACQSPQPEVTEPPINVPAAAPEQPAAPPDLDAFVGEVLATLSAPPALGMVVDEERYRTDGAGRSRTDYGVEAGTDDVAAWLTAGGHVYESFRQDDGSVLWGDHGPSVGPLVPDLGLSQGCRSGWEHHGFDLVLERPAHHLVCGYDEYWVDRDSLLVTRHQRNPDPLEYDTNVEQVLDLRLGPQPAELFELPGDAAIYDAACFQRGSLTCVPRPSGVATGGSEPTLTWSRVDRDDVSDVAWLGDRFGLLAADGSVGTSNDGVTWDSLEASDPASGYGDVWAGSDAIATWADAMVGWTSEDVRSVDPPGSPAAKSDFSGPVGAVGIGPPGIVAQVHSGIDFDAFVTRFLGTDWVGQIKEFEFADGVLHIATEDGRVADIVMADEGLGPGDVADRGYGWLSTDGAVWNVIPDFPSNITDVVGVADGFIARGESMFHSPDGLNWSEIGPYTEGPMLGWRAGALVLDPSGRLDLWTATGGPTTLSVPGTALLSAGSQPESGRSRSIGTGPLGIVSMGTSSVLFSSDAMDWTTEPLPEAMYAAGGGRHAPTAIVGNDSVLALMWSNDETPAPTLWLGTPTP